MPSTTDSIELGLESIVRSSASRVAPDMEPASPAGPPGWRPCREPHDRLTTRAPAHDLIEHAALTVPKKHHEAMIRITSRRLTQSQQFGNRHQKSKIALRSRSSRQARTKTAEHIV
jgi:hypothetical protein